MLILCGLVQKMPKRFSRRWAKTIPAVMAAGRAGGTVMVMMSRDSMTMVLAGTWKETELIAGETKRPAVGETPSHLVDDAEDDSVEEADPGHAHQTQQELVGVAVQPEVSGLGVQDGPNQLAFLGAEACSETEVNL